MKILNNLTSFAPLLAAATLAVCTGVSLSGYEESVFEPVKALVEEIVKDEEEKEVQGNFDLEDGVYQGTGTGFAGKITVAVEIKNKTIVAIEIIDSGADDAAFVNRAKGVIEKIIAAQSFDVDVVSGATYSSNGIIAAVKNALTGEVDNNTTATLPTGQGSTTVSIVEEASEYKDGTYYGSGIGFAGTTTVKVVISDGKITSITIMSTNDDSSYIQSASAVISRIIAGQTTNVDTVSGATYSSVGIIEAVRDALSQAAVNPSEDTENTNDKQEEDKPVIEGRFPYLDGTYYGTGEGYISDITVAVEIKGETIRSIVIVEHGDDEAFMARAEKILDDVVANQTTDVDVVSGATYSSEGILEAIENALLEAEKATNDDEPEQPEAPDDSEQPETPDDSEQPEAPDDNKEPEQPEAPDEDETDVPQLYNNGEYKATVVCEPDENKDFDAYNLSLKITVENDKIIAITDIFGDGGEDNEPYIEWAVNGRKEDVGVVTQILEKGMVDDEIDVVTRATCTSNSIIEACKRALEQAKIIVEEAE